MSPGAIHCPRSTPGMNAAEQSSPPREAEDDVGCNGAAVSASEAASCVADGSSSGDSAVLEIAQHCSRLGHVTPEWVPIEEPTCRQTYGCALRVRLSPRVHRVYAVDPTFATFADAQRACATAALATGVLAFIRDGADTAYAAALEPDDPPQADADGAPLSVLAFFDALPRPLPAELAGASPNAPATLNKLVQRARGSGLAARFLYTTDPARRLHGCVLRLQRPGEARVFLVDARFARRADAKAAVCLQALADGAGAWLKEVAREVALRVSPERRALVLEKVYPALLAAMRQARPAFEWVFEQDAYGCAMAVELDGSARSYAVPAEYATQNDAKTAVVHLAYQEGALDFVRLRGRPPYPGYMPWTPADVPVSGAKRKPADDNSVRHTKRRKSQPFTNAAAAPWTLRGHLAAPLQYASNTLATNLPAWTPFPSFGAPAPWGFPISAAPCTYPRPPAIAGPYPAPASSL